jgi:hypothetical protein
MRLGASSWPLALAAYNAGEEAVERAIAAAGTSENRRPNFEKATARWNEELRRCRGRRDEPLPQRAIHRI